MNDSTTLQILVQLKDEATSAMQSLSGNIKSSLGGIAGPLAQIGATMTAVGGAIDGVMYELITSAEGAQNAMTQFNSIMSNSAGNSQAVRDQLLAAADAVVALGFDHETASVSLARFYQQTKDVTTAITANNTAMDLSRAYNLDLSTSTRLVQEVLAGNNGMLTRYGIILEKTKDPLQNLINLQDKVKGSAEAFSKTASGATQALGESWKDLMQTLGTTLLPLVTQIVTAITPIILSITKWVSQHQELVKIILIAVGVFGILLTVLGTLAIAVAGVIAFFSSWAGIIAVGVMAAIAALVAIVVVVVEKWQSIVAFFKNLWNDITNIFNSAIKAIVGFFDNLLNKVVQVASAISNSVVGKVVGTAFGGVTTVASAAFNIGTSLGKAIGLASGGIVTQPTLAVIGEAGPEAVVPLSDSGSGFSSGAAININIGNLYGTDQVAAKNFAALIAKTLNQQLRLRTY